MRFDVITLFPELFGPFLSTGVTRRAFASGQVAVHLWNPRDYAESAYRRVDDRPFGGGPGMVMMAAPLERCLAAIRSSRAEPAQAVAPLVLFSPVGARLDHGGVEAWSKSQGAVLLCGRYEGIDQRFVDRFVHLQISLGDFVLSGGELVAMVLLDAVARLQPGVLHDTDSHVHDSFNPALDGLLDCPHYTRPEVWQGDAVPAPLMSGHHAHIEAWRRAQSLRITQQQRPDLLDRARSAGKLTADDEKLLRQFGPGL